MELTKIFGNKTNATYYYVKRNGATPCPPDGEKESVNAPVYSATTGNLFLGKPVSWKGYVLVNGCVDICVSLNNQYFIDHITLSQTDYSQLGGVEIWTSTKGENKKIGSITPAQNGVISERDLTISVGEDCDNLIIRLCCAYKDIGLKSVEIYGATNMENVIYPIPKSVSFDGGFLPWEKVSVDFSPVVSDVLFTYLCDLFEQNHGVRPIAFSGGSLKFELLEKNNDGYEITTTNSDCTVTANSKRALFYAVSTLIQTATNEGLKTGKIVDEPFMDLRGFHLALPHKREREFFEKLVKEVLVPMRYNAIILQISGAMRYDNYPEINEKWIESCERFEKGEWPQPAHYGFISRDIWEKDEVASLCEYIRSFGIEIIPEVQSLSHSQYISTAYPFLAEIEDKQTGETNLYEADERPAEFYYHNLCPSHPQYYDYIFGVADEVLSVVKPERYIHFGHDEVYILGKCKKCREKGATAVFVDEVTHLNNYAKSKNLTMMIWSDMLQNEHYSVPDARGLVPKDIIMLDFTWYFHPESDIEDRLLSEGYEVVMGNMYSSHYTRYCERARKKGMIGAEVSTWVECSEHSYAYEGKIYDLVYSAGTMWSESYQQEYRRAYAKIVNPIVWNIRKKIGGFGESDLVTRTLPSASIKNVPSSLLWKIPYERAITLTPNSEQVEIAVGDFVNCAFITHSTDRTAQRIMWKPALTVGEYTFVYEDGTTASESANYGENLYYYSHIYGQPIPSFLFRHEGYTATYYSKPICGKDDDGGDYTLLTLPFVNPYPDKKVQKIVLAHSKKTDANLIVYDLKTN